MIRRLANLVCPHGHLSYSPTPDAWLGRLCGFAGTCAAPLERRRRGR